MRRSPVAAGLLTLALLAMPATASAAPPQHYVDSGCIDDANSDYIVCYAYDEVSAYTATPSGNEIYHTSGTNSFEVTYADGSTQGGSYTFNRKWVYKRGQQHVDRLQSIQVTYVGDASCTDVTYYKVSNGELKVEDHQVTCSP